MIDLKYIKKKIIAILSLVIIVVWLFDCMVRISGGAGGIFGNNNIFKKDIVIRPEKNICLHFMPNPGSGEEVVMYTYYCIQSPNWNKVKYESSPEGVIDWDTTTECPIISHNNDIEVENIIQVKQDKLCKDFAHDYKDDEEQMFVIDYSGKIRKEKIVR